jgi:hypothetical protein
MVRPALTCALLAPSAFAAPVRDGRAGCGGVVRQAGIETE